MGNLCALGCDPCSCFRKPWPENRTVYVGNRTPPGEVVIPEKYCANVITTSKYTLLNFVPKNLFEQFRRIANFYFLLMGIVALVIDSPVSPLTSLFPLVFVVVVTAIKQGYEDVLRHRADNQVNLRPVSVIRDGSLKQVKSMDLRVGDIIRLQSNEGLPCDVVMLSSSEEGGECFVTTANLDGEANLKQFFASPTTKSNQSVEDLNRLICTIKCEQPITDLYAFKGNVIIHEKGNMNDGKTFPLGADNVLLRGMRIRNTDYVFGCVVYAGRDTKVSLNSRSSTVKMSRVEKSMNKFLVVFLILLVLECGILVGLRRWWYSIDKHKSGVQAVWYMDGMDESTVDALDVVVEFLSFMVLLNYIIPISMYVTVELQKVIGSYFFENDIEMYDPGTNEAAKARTSDLNEELGLVEYLFTDKTGTLTENDMQFRQCAISGTKYIDFGGMICEYRDIPGVNHQPVFKYNDDIKTFLLALALCHTVRVEVKDGTVDGFSTDGFAYEYQASSPDEKALVEACRRYRVVYHGIKEEKAVITVDGQKHYYIMHHVLEFDPTRKRMSVIVEDETGRTFLIVKGADTAMISKLVSGNPQTCERSVTDYALQGLRTLVIGQKELSKEEFDTYDNMIKVAKSSLQNRDEEISHAYTKIEDELTYLGVTAVEDRLQDGVPETITALRNAGIQVWVLTGDKEETAVNISYSAGHFYQGILELRITKMSNEEDCHTAVDEIIRILEDERIRGQKNYALIVDGPSLAHVLQKQDLKKKLIWVCENVVTVLCCRMSPLQKSQVVRLIKTSKSKPVTAAIGDGANDVSMILEAHVGLGLMGKEGRQAVRSSDYAFGRFRFLQRVFLVHGHYFYIRIATLVLHFFYKNIAFITGQFYYAFFNAFSEQTLFESIILTMYNITFTSLPVLVYSIFEKHIPMDVLMRRPQFYKVNRRNSALSAGQFLSWNLLGLYHSLVFFFGCYATFYFGSSLFPSGIQFGNYDFGVAVCTACVIVVNVKLMLHWYDWNWLTFFSFFLTFAGYFALLFIYGADRWTFFLSEYSMYGAFTTIYSCGTLWLVYLLLSVTALLPDISMKAWRDMTSPLFAHKKTKKRSKAKDVPVRMVDLRENNNVSYICGLNGTSSTATSQLSLVPEENVIYKL